LITTPESLEIILVSGNVPTARLFKYLKYIIIDEVHTLVACDHGNHLISVLERIRSYYDYDFQCIGFSATAGPLSIFILGTCNPKGPLLTFQKMVKRPSITCIKLFFQKPIRDQLLNEPSGNGGDAPLPKVHTISLGLRNKIISNENELDQVLNRLKEKCLKELNAGIKVRFEE